MHVAHRIFEFWWRKEKNQADIFCKGHFKEQSAPWRDFCSYPCPACISPLVSILEKMTCMNTTIKQLVSSRSETISYSEDTNQSRHISKYEQKHRCPRSINKLNSARHEEFRRSLAPPFIMIHRNTDIVTLSGHCKIYSSPEIRLPKGSLR